MLRCCCARTSPSTTNEVHPGPSGCGFRIAADNVISAVAALLLEPSPVSSPPADNTNKPPADEETSHGDDVVITIPDSTDDDDQHHPTGQGEAGPHFVTRY